jgi:myo-inositol 2-dehydrogenase/D-chiro-inositol 1-dehydrogenase
MVMLGDVFEDRLERSLAALKNVGIDLSRGQCVLGFDAYKRVMEADVDIVLLTTPPNFRPVQLAAAVAAGKHIFVEKPVGVDPVGCRSVMETGKAAALKKLSIVAGDAATARARLPRHRQGAQGGGRSARSSEAPFTSASTAGASGRSPRGCRTRTG